MPRRRPAPVGHVGPGGRQAARRGRGGDRKPFGTGLASAQDLNQILRIQLPEPVIFRVNHFLSDELVRRVIVLRFLNRVFEPTWNAVHVDHVDISWLESLTLEGRASYYDKAGAPKTMVQKPSLGSHGAVMNAWTAGDVPTQEYPAGQAPPGPPS